MAKIPTKEKVSQSFPAGLRVLAIDSHPTDLENIKQMGIGYNYQVSTYSHVLHAWNDVRKGKDCIDVILIDVYMPNMDGYEILQRIRKLIDVPVIVMSSDNTVSSRLKAIKHGACEYWKKPLCEKKFRNMWEHVYRKAWSENKLHKFRILDDDNDDPEKRKNDDSATKDLISRLEMSS